MNAPILKKGSLSHGLTAESRIVGILEAFERQLEGVKGSAVADADGLLITHASRTLIHPGDRDVLAAMMTVVQQFVRDAFRGKAGVMEEVEMANLRVHFVRGQACTIAIVSTGRLREGYVHGALGALQEFEGKNVEALNPWNGQVTSLNGTDNLVEELLHRRAA